MNSSAAVGFDALGYFTRLKDAGIPDIQARIQAEALQEHAELQARELHEAIRRHDEHNRKELATRGDIQDVRLEVEKVRGDVEKTRADVEKVRAELKTDIEKIRAELKTDIEKVRIDVEKVKYDLLKWMFGLGIGLVAVMATGFGTLGVIMAKALNRPGF